MVDNTVVFGSSMFTYFIFHLAVEPTDVVEASVFLSHPSPRKKSSGVSFGCFGQVEACHGGSSGALAWKKMPLGTGWLNRVQISMMISKRWWFYWSNSNGVVLSTHLPHDFLRFYPWAGRIVMLVMPTCALITTWSLMNCFTYEHVLKTGRIAPTLHFLQTTDDRIWVL